MEESITRVCTKCKEDKPLSQYRFMRYGKQQKGTVCKDCCREIKKEWKNKNRDKVNSAQKKWRIENKDKVSAYTKKHRAVNSLSIKKYSAIYRVQNKDSIKERAKRWYEENKDYSKAWRERNKEKARFTQVNNAHKRRDKKMGAVIKREEWEELKDFYGNTCLCCKRTDVKLTMDHVVPLSRGGTHEIRNIQPLCKSCNSKKHTDTTDYRIKNG